MLAAHKWGLEERAVQLAELEDSRFLTLKSRGTVAKMHLRTSPSSFPIFTIFSGDSGPAILVLRDMTTIKTLPWARREAITSREALAGDTRPGDFGGG